MKIIFTLIVIIAFFCELSYAIEKEMAVALYLAAINSCIPSTGVGEDDIGKFKNHEIVETQEGKCLAACVLKSLAVMTPDNKQNVDILKAGIGVVYDNSDYVKKAMEVVEECMGATDENECEAAYKMEKCWIIESAARGLPHAM